jgi:hypothetical protein
MIMEDKENTITFKRYRGHETIIEGMQKSKEAMIEEGLWHENITFEEWADYAGSHILINEKE